MKIILASQSPRRKKLLKKIIPHFEIKPSNINENSNKEKNQIKFAKRVAEMKAIFVAKKIKNRLLLLALIRLLFLKIKSLASQKMIKMLSEFFLTYRVKNNSSLPAFVF